MSDDMSRRCLDEPTSAQVSWRRHSDNSRAERRHQKENPGTSRGFASVVTHEFAMRGYCLEAGLLVPRIKSCISSKVTKPSLLVSIALKMRS